MQSCLPQLTCVQSELMIGRLTHTPHLYYIPILDINNRQIKVPCLSLDITIEQLLEEYKANSAGVYLIKKTPFLIVSQGELFGSMALPTDTVVSYGFNFNEICFRVGDPDREDLDKMLDISLKSQLKEKDEEIKVKILFQNNLYQISIKSSFTLLAFKKTIIQQIPSLKSKSPDLLQVQHRGFFIIDDKALLSKYQIASNSVILVIIRKINGCFSRRAVVMLADHKEVTIDKIKQGDKVLSFNQNKKQLEIDTVSYIQKNVIKQALEVEFQDGRVIETTPNHKFLCDDGEYRCFTKEGEKASLQEGSTLALYSNGTSKIKSVFNLPISPQDQQFFHLSIQTNHNFIVNGLIAHNMFLKIKFQTNLIEQINATPQDLIKAIKDRIEEKYHIQVHHQKLLYFGKELENYRTIADYNIPKESTLHFQLKNVQGNLVNEGTLILMADGNSIEVQKIKRGNKIAILNNFNEKKAMTGDVVNTIEKVLTNDFMVLNLGSFHSTDELIVSSDSYIQSQNGEIHCVRDLCYELDEETRPRIKRVGSNSVSVKGVSHYQSKQMQVFYKIGTNSHNFVAKSVIMYDFVANLIFLKQNKRIQKVVLGSDPSETMGSIKQKLKAIQKIDPNVLFKVNIDQAHYLFDDKKFTNDDSLQKYEIDSSKIIEVIVDQSSPSILKSTDILLGLSLNVSVNLEDKDIYLQVSSSEKYMIKYFQYRDSTVEEIIREVLPHFDTSCFFVFSDTLIFPSDYLLKLEQSPQFQKTNEIQLLMVKNQKMAFLHNIDIRREGIKNHGVFLKEQNKVNLQNFVSSLSKEFISKNKEFLEMKSVWYATKRIEEDQSIVQDNFKLQIFYNPFLYLTSRKYNQLINTSIKNFTQFKEEFSNSQSVFTLIKDIYLNMQLIPNYYDKCFLGVNNFRFSRYFKEKNAFYLYGFTTAFKQSEKIRKSLYHQSGSLLIIRSLNGRQISKFSLYPQEKEVLFAPFTCFFVEKIVHQEEYDEVYVVEISSPISFQKDILLWVDDEPKNNIRDIKKIYKEVDIQILQATSTSEALRWIEEFGWLLNWKGLEFKIISDMGRWESSNNETILNKRAGIDLLIELYNNYGVTARTMIYCGDEKKALQMAKDAHIPKDRYDITTSSAKLIEFCRKKLK